MPSNTRTNMLSMGRAVGVVFPLTVNAPYNIEHSPPTSTRPSEQNADETTAAADDKSRKTGARKKAGKRCKGTHFFGKRFPRIVEEEPQKVEVTRNSSPDEPLRFPLLGPTRQETQMFLKSKSSLAPRHGILRHGESNDERGTLSLAESITPTAMRVDPSPRMLPKSLNEAHLRRYNTMSDLRPQKLPPKRISSLPNIHENRHPVESIKLQKQKTSMHLHREITNLNNREKTLVPSKYGYHPRSQSATFKRLDRARMIIDDKINKQVAALVQNQHGSQNNGTQNNQKVRAKRVDFNLVRVGSITLGMRGGFPDRISTESPLPVLPFNLDPELYESTMKERRLLLEESSSDDLSKSQSSKSGDRDEKNNAAEKNDNGSQVEESELSENVEVSAPATRRHIRVMLPLMMEEEEEA